MSSRVSRSAFWVVCTLLSRRPGDNKIKQNNFRSVDNTQKCQGADAPKSKADVWSARTTSGEQVDLPFDKDIACTPGALLDWNEYVPQSGLSNMGISISTPSKENKFTTATFTDQNSAYDYTVDSMPDQTFGQADLGDATLEDFFRRPIKIASYEWSTSLILFEKFNPWTLFFENDRVINRISNFANLRAKLKLKIVINGNGFHYGRAIASYLPLPNLDQNTLDRAFFNQDVVEASQRPHVYLDPTLSQGGEMTLPFFWYHNTLSIPKGDWRQMGNMIIQQINDLKHANGADDRVTISVFAWAEDVNLSMPTASNALGISPQSGVQKAVPKQQDEYGTGPISRPASMVARAAGALRNAPVIGPYARATELAASATKNVAAMFGYSRPAVLNDIVPYKPTYVGNLANTNMPDSVQRLTLDSKQEVTVDPRTVGLGDTDEMSITPLAMRESYLVSFPWAVSTTTESLLWNARVAPTMYRENTIGGTTELHMTPMCWVSQPFRYWRGTLKYRFQVVSSNYHKGRLKVVYEPYFNTENEYNTNYTQIIDIAEDKDFTITVGWGNFRPYCISGRPGVDNESFYYNTSPISGNETAINNGVLKVFVVNELTVPNSTVDNDISINVFVSACDDFEVANPCDRGIRELAFFPTPAATVSTEVWPLGKNDELKRLRELEKFKLDTVEEEKEKIERLAHKLDFSKYVPQSGVESVQADAENTADPSAPMAPIEDAMQLGKDCLDRTDPTPGIFVGEEVTSIRQVLKRYCYSETFAQQVGGTASLKRRANDLPLYRGWDPQGIHSGANGANPAPYNRVKNTMLNWFMPAYAGWRGAIRWKYVNRFTVSDPDAAGSNVPAPSVSTMSITRVANADNGYDLSGTNYDFAGADANQLAQFMMNHFRGSWDGTLVTYTQGNNTLEAELPWYLNERFKPAKRMNRVNRESNGDIAQFHDFETFTSVGNDGAYLMDTYCATGEDFNLYFFVSTPIVYYQGENDPTLPSPARPL